MIMLRHIFEWGIEQGIEVCDFTVGDESYKDHWCDQELSLYDHLSAKTALGLLYVFVEKNRRVLKRKIKQSRTLFSLSKKIRKQISSFHAA